MSDENRENQERRRAIRRQCRVYVGTVIQICIAGDWSEDSLEVKGRLLDLNAGGARLSTKERFEKGQQLRLRILMPGQPEVQAEALVCWAEPLPEEGGFGAGVKFRKLSGQSTRAIDAFLATIGE